MVDQTYGRENPEKTEVLETKVIFLDMDGVICLRSGIEIECLQNLRKIVEETKARIVISSSWRMFPITRERLDKMLVDFGMEAALGWTPTKGYSRVDEIHHWLDEFEEKTTDKEIIVTQWVALDDEDLIGIDPIRMNGHFVWTDMEHGLNPARAQRAIDLLNSQD